MKSYLLWDHDGVLVETEPLYFEATRECIAELGIELELDDYLRNMITGNSSWEKALAAGVPEQRVAACRDRRNRLYQQLLVERDIEIPGVAPLLRQLSASYSMAIVTTARRQDFELIHAERNLVEHMDFVLASGDYPRAKPAPDPYLAALERFAAEAQDALVIEDSQRGLQAAVAAGIDCVVVANEFVKAQDFSAATYRIDSLAELPELLSSL
jgi:HAD superfamily hydrolase (TIGR01509 family)